MGNGKSKRSDFILTEGRHSTFPASLIKSKVANAEKLKIVRIDQNSLTNLDGIEVFTNLTHLSLRKNQIHQIPKELILLVNLTSLHLDENFIETIPEWLSQLHHLELLSVKGR
jgi:Leucine-rich repeat (LRR) protein